MLELNLDSLEFEFTTAAGMTRRALNGSSLSEHWAWLRAEVHKHTDAPIEAREYDGIPEHGIASGAAVDVDVAASRELLRYYRNAAALLESHRRGTEHASIVRVWPHHFDVAVLQLLDPELDLEEARSINLGLSPGDGNVPMPYFYLVPWPAPSGRPDAPLKHGTWVDEGWFGAVLNADEVVNASRQSDTVSAFFDDAYAICTQLLETS